MKRISLSSVGRQIGLGLALVAAVTLVTLLFSFMGTISIGAITGMMMGAARQRRWQAILVSLVFPAVSIAFLNVGTTNLTPRQCTQLAAVCWGAYWVTYLLTCALLHFEKQDGPPPSEHVALSAAAAAGQAAPAKAKEGVGVGLRAAASGQESDPGPDELLGVWSRETSGPNGHSCRKVIEVARDQLAVSLVDFDGQMHLVSKGNVKLEKLGPLKILKVLEAEENLSGDFAGLSLHPGVWVYRVAGQTLTLAENFEETAPDQEPIIETYLRLWWPAEAWPRRSHPERGAPCLSHQSGNVVGGIAEMPPAGSQHRSFLRERIRP